ncbi:PTS glucose transporter subunit IIA [Myceligenerans pegani]|uniref:PTS glucose transporter subunit IIA n=1 Tax=Myceligenerans pegani TaxID=2776917 RepID=A0ABR9MT90_9MICO|nr:PTS glucose transporter subunit IIA [Myceligenerans sp. TRM 65318]MBE1874164.1 PTS glucose transporter subunit IIA [Myceligenerans sp. TRM 65318]MBE3016436.1 PTS glucose transporter subunit IIA [Myceligenerans sp. TRM 65318]
MALTVLSPVSGTAVAMTDVPDPVFADGMVGPGIAVDPATDGATSVAVAPIDGTVMALHPHGFVVSDGARRAVLVHLGIDTVRLGGDGFTSHVAKGDSVRAGDHLISWSPADVVAGGLSPLVPVVALEIPADRLEVLVAPGDRVLAGAGATPGTALLRIP